MEAVILAGGEMPAALQGLTPATERALLPVGGQPILSHVLNSLATVSPVTRIICVTTPDALKILPARIGEVAVTGLPSGDKLSANLLAGARAAQSDRILIVTGDGPLATGRTWMQFLDGASVNRLEAAYAVVRDSAMEAQFPGATRTYARFNDGAFSGGNAFLVPRARLPELENLIETAFAARKNPLGMAKLLGFGFIIKAVFPPAERERGRNQSFRVCSVAAPDASRCPTRLSLLTWTNPKIWRWPKVFWPPASANRNKLSNGSITNIMKEIIATADAPAALGPYAQAIKVNDMIFASGQLPVNPKTNEIVAGGIREQTEQALLNLRAVMEEGEATLDDIVKVTIFMVDLADFDAMNAVYKLFFPQHRNLDHLLPARSTVQVAGLPRDAQIEMEAIAVITHSRYEPELY